MKLTVFLLLFSVAGVLANKSYSQTKVLNLNMREATVKQVLNAIEEQSKFYFLYSENLIDAERKVNVDIENQKIEQALNLIFEGTDVDYSIRDRIIVLSTREVKGNLIIQQQNSVSGTVTDESGQPLPGVTVVVKGTTQGTVTNADGNYSLTNIPEDATLVFSFVGMQTEEIEVGNQTTIDVTMEVDAIGIGEVVAIGYGTRKAGELTGSISSVDANDIKDMMAVNATDALKGTTSGVNIIDVSTPGGDPIIRIRGMGTINDNDPLWIVDGVPGSSVNPDNIESISVLKDASAQAIYGARAANGVILVTTKSGKKNQPVQVDLKVTSGISQNTNFYNLLNTQEYGELMWMQTANENGGTLPAGFSHPQYGNGPQPVIPNYIWPAGAEDADHSTYDPMNNIIMQANKEGTDWLDEASRNATYTEVSLGVNGGSNNTIYAFQGGYLKEEGMLKYTSYERYNLRANVTSDATSWLQVGTRLALTYSKDNGNQSNNWVGSVFGNIYRMQPIVPVYDIMGNYGGTRAPATGNAKNPLFSLDKNQWDQTQFMRATGNVFAEADIVEGLSFKTLFGFNYNTQQSRDLEYIEWAAAMRETTNAYSEGNNQTVQWNWSNTLQYSNTFGLHDITALVGTEAIENSYRTNTAGRQGYFLLNPDFFQLDAGTVNQTNSGNLSEWALFSVFGRLNYQFDDRYLLEAVVRRDASSRFGKYNNAGVFPAASVGWRISEESFMSFTDSWLNQFKIRAGYGATGNDRIGNYNSYTTYVSELGGIPWNRNTANVGSYYPIAGGNSTDGAVGFRRDAVGNAAVVWETTTTTNFGFDMTFFDNFDVMLDIWQRNTEDMLYPQQIPAVAGRANAPSINVGEMKNKGFDLELGYNGTALQSELTYTIGLNVSRYKNELVSLSGNDNEFLSGGSTESQDFTRAENGSEFPAFYGYTIDGIFQSQEEAAAHPELTEDPSYNQEGVFKIRDVNGDGQIDTDDRGFIGSPHPDFTAGFIMSMNYKGFSLYTNLFASVGNEVANTVNHLIDFNKLAGNRSKKRLYESYGSPYLSNNADAAMPMARINDERDGRPSTYFIEDGSYLRMQNLRLSYDLNRLIPNKDLFRNLTVYFHSTNLFTITNYSGLDPEIGAAGMNQGVDKGGWPTPRRFLFGLQFGL